MADNYLVISNPSACVASTNSTHCAAEFRVARRSLGVVPQSQEQVTVAMVAGVRAQVAAIIAAADEIKASNVRNDHFTNAMARACARQANIALRYLGQAGDAIEAGTNQRDVPYWLAAADTQVDNCVDGFQTFSPSTEGLPAYIHLEYTAKKAGSTLEALVSITNAAAKAAVAAATDVPSTEEDVAPVRGRRMAVRSSSGAGSAGSGAMDWLEPGLYAQLQELQTRMNAEFAAGAGGEDSVGGYLARRQLDDDDDDDEEEEDRKDEEKKAKKEQEKKDKEEKKKKKKSKENEDSESDSGDKKSSKKKSSKKASPTAGPMVVSPSLTASATVGSGYSTIQAAIDAAPGGTRFVIYIPAGTYNEQVLIETTDIVLIGAGADKTIITGDESYGSGSGTFESATVGVDSDRFVAFGIKFVNTAGPENHQAVAFRATGDQTALFDCAFDGAQDTLYVDAGRQYYKNCWIGGSMDFIFGDAAVVIDAPKIQLHPSPSFVTITASGRKSETPTGIVIRDADIAADSGTTEVYLGRPWKKCAFTVFINANLPAKKCSLTVFINANLPAVSDREGRLVVVERGQLHVASPLPCLLIIPHHLCFRASIPPQVIEKDGWLSWNEGSCMILAEAGSKGPGCMVTHLLFTSFHPLLPQPHPPSFPPQVIEKDGWLSWNEGSCMFLAEAGSKGPGAASPRADWVEPGIITDVSGYDANSFTEVNSWLSWAG
ncbi:unnamed protein product [Closterium sp. NIES-65]|nr:unnamed protein product [Closterium sp. NIES-65]